MEKQTLGTMIAALRKEKGMTQQDLAGKMGVTDKAVSKWERDLSLPDIHSVSRLAEIFSVSVETLLQAKSPEGSSSRELPDTILGAVGLAMGIAVTVLTVLGELEAEQAFAMVGIGLAAVSLRLLRDRQI